MSTLTPPEETGLRAVVAEDETLIRLDLVEVLTGAGYRVVAFDQRGQGRSTTEPDDLTRDAFVNDTIAVIEHADAGPVVLVGQSMGAHTAMLTAARRPDLVSQLILIEGGLGGVILSVSSDTDCRRPRAP